MSTRKDIDHRTQQFLSKAYNVHNSTYDYSIINYVNSYTPITILCNKHGAFNQRPRTHLEGSGCPKCDIETKSTSISEFITRSNDIHNNKYQYPTLTSVRMVDMVDIVCPTHGPFVQRVGTHLSGRGCLKCSIKSRQSSTQSFIDKAKALHGDKYDYSKVEYINAHTKVQIICPIHGPFMSDPVLHYKRTGCPQCSSTYSVGNRKIQNILNLNNIPYFEEYRFDDCRNKYPLPFDFYLHTKNILIEFDGKHHFEPIYKSKNDTAEIITQRFAQTQINDTIKTQYAVKHNITLIRIPYFESHNINNIINDLIL